MLPGLPCRGARFKSVEGVEDIWLIAYVAAFSSLVADSSLPFCWV